MRGRSCLCHKTPQSSRGFFQVTDFKRKFDVPDFRAKGEKPYGSRTLGQRRGVVHKVIHSFCAKRRTGMGGRENVCAATYLRTGKLSNGIKGFGQSQRACAQSYPQKMCRSAVLGADGRRTGMKTAGPRPKTGNFVTKPPDALFLRNAKKRRGIKALCQCRQACAQSYPQKMCKRSARRAAAWHNFRSGPWLPKMVRCLIFAHCEISLTNQGTFLLSNLLHTRLSTKDVQNLSRPAVWRKRPDIGAGTFPSGIAACLGGDETGKAGKNAPPDAKLTDCRVFTQHQFSYKNQRTCPLPMPLRTVLSTEGVQNFTCRSVGNTLHCRIRCFSVSHVFFTYFSLISGSFFCSPFFTLQAGPSGRC